MRKTKKINVEKYNKILNTEYQLFYATRVYLGIKK